LVFLVFWVASFLGSLSMGWQGRKRPTSLKTMGRQEKNETHGFLFKGCGFKTCGLFCF
jgi:hypothetical protein